MFRFELDCIIILCIGYRTFSNKITTVLYWIWEASFSARVHRWRPKTRIRKSTQVKAETPKASIPLPVYEYGKRSFPYSIMLSSFVWNVRYLTCTIIELVNKMKYASFWFFSFLSFFFLFFCFEQKINLYFKGTPVLYQGGNYK